MERKITEKEENIDDNTNEEDYYNYIKKILFLKTRTIH